MTLAEVKNGKTFKIAGIEFIKFSEESGRVTAVAKNTLFNSEIGNNEFPKSRVFERLNNEILPTITEAVGEENLFEFETDLLALDGTTYGTMKSKIAVPTLDFYRQNRPLFDEYKLDIWWWLCTADSTNNLWHLCVSPSGFIYDCIYYDFIGVRPFCIFNSSISVS